ncbi:4'-phosphopantetheinyl transferase superfamily protein [Enterococcus sp. BWT-B8]|uniref:4'-phosphopantetheinyl transferase family protein n=1 Tax=Enterococcus sp. BWT-B8 TaxID=2885157 RepID=UPI001E588CA3|nr:4'-phosphopantetheinyl transferase superfamily protein [Enterococcus sp. BWT-B8]MCB5951769.1 4'-phosphopantetheinyl transferase superfamily protein [Enterococcus sp. BWT-B8]
MLNILIYISLLLNSRYLMLITNYLKIDCSLDSNTWSDWYSLIDIQRQNQIKKFKFSDDKLRSLAAGILLRCMLFNHCHLSLDHLTFSRSNYGKPFLASHPDIFFNLTHSSGFIACSISSLPVGIDIERMEKIDLKSISSFFSTKEQQFIHSRENQLEEIEAFYSIWTLKEAFTKKIGAGLSIPLDAYSFDLNEKTISLSKPLANDAQFYSCTIENHYKFALCSSLLDEHVENYLSLTELIKKMSEHKL